MLQRLDAMESELSALIESLRTGSNRLNADLQLLEGNLTEVSEAVSPRPRFEREPSAERFEAEPVVEPPATEIEADHAEVLEGAAVEETPYEEVEAEQVMEPEPVTAGGDSGDDTEGARLIALNMALNGTPREETDRYLAENFNLSDRSGLLDEVYASVEG
jgi:hypothetical protein